MAGAIGSAMDMIFGNAQVGNPNPLNTGLPPNPADAQNRGNNMVPAPRSADQSVLSPSNPNNNNIGLDAEGNQVIPGAKTKGEESPLDEYKDIWEPVKDKEGNPVVKPDSSVVAFDETKFNAALEKLDFTKTADPELMQKALGGDQASLLQLMNGIGKSSLSMTTKLTKNLVESALKSQGDSLRSEMQDQIRSSSTRNSLVEENPALNHPALKPLISSLEGQLRNKFPEATSQELTAHAKKALTAMAHSITGTSGDANNNQSPGKKRTANGTDEVDWDQFITGGDVNNISQM